MKIITDELIEKYKNHLFDEEKASATAEKYLRDIREFAARLDGRAVEKSLVTEYKRELTQRYSPNSINSKISSLNGFFEFNGWFDCKVKALKIQRQIFASREKELTKSEYERLLKAAKNQNSDRCCML